MVNLWIDAETYSEAPLDIGGMDRYWRHPSTGVHCLGVAVDDGPVEMITLRFSQTNCGMCLGIGECTIGEDEGRCPYCRGTGYSRMHSITRGQSAWDEFKVHVANGATIWAHKAEFEQEVLKRLGVSFKRSQFRCVMAMAATAAFPLSLEKLAMAVGLHAGKHTKGRAAMFKFCVPNPKTGKPWRYEDCPDEWEALYEYCAQDVVLERDCAARLPLLSDEEQQNWIIDQEANNRGIGMDLRAAAGLMKLADSEMQRLNAEMVAVTGGLVQTAKDHPLALAKFLDLDSVAKDTLDRFLARPPSDWKPAHLRAAQIRQEAAKASVVKLRPIIQQTSEDSRYRWSKQFNAAATGRGGGRGVQPDNLPSGTLGWSPELQDAFLRQTAAGYTQLPDGLLTFGSASGMDMIKQCIRGLIVPALGHELIETDYSGIEARLGAWTVGDLDVLDVFFGDGKIYERQASLMTGRPYQEIGKKDPARQDAKIWVLSAQYQAGAERLYNSALDNARRARREFTMTFEDAERHTKMWREAHPAFPKMWKELEKAAKLAVKNPGERFVVHLPGGQPIVYCYRGYEGDEEVYLPMLLCKLPSGRIMHYPFPKLEMKEVPGKDGSTYMKESLAYRVVDNRQWTWTFTYGGMLFENVVQGEDACILRHGVQMVNGAGIPIVTTCHDSMLTETPIGSVKPERLAELAKTPAPWALTLPVECEVKVLGSRYRKE